MITMYGIKNCDTIRKARAWLDGRKVAYAFHDYKTAGIERARLAQWCSELGWEVLLNRKGTTFRTLAANETQGLTAGKAVDLMVAHPSLIKRPVLDVDGRLFVGFKPETYDAVFMQVAR